MKSKYSLVENLVDKQKEDFLIEKINL
jgi:hypothetical protein